MNHKILIIYYNYNMKIGIAGIGVVGSAILKSFQNKNVNVIGYDKFKNLGSIYDLLTTDIIFLCLPTPYTDYMKQYDKSSIHDVCKKLANNDYKGLVVLKSTVEPQTTEKLSKQYNLNMCHNPEFLTARSAFEDFENQDHIIIGKTSTLHPAFIDELTIFYKKHYPNAMISLCTSNESELMKLGVNNFYAVKVQFFNELYLVAQKQNHTDYNVVKDLMLKNNWIHPMHTNVPGPDGQLSYGGMCFPKDTNALLQYLIKMDSPHCVIEGTINERNSIRQD